MDPWRIGVNALYVLVVLLFVCILYFVLKDESFLYKTNLGSTLQMFKKRATQKTVHHYPLEQRTVLAELLQYTNLTVDDSGSIASEARDIAAFVSFLYAAELTSSILTSVIAKIEAFDDSVDNWNAAYTILSVVLSARDFAMSAEMSDESTRLIKACLALVKRDANTRNYNTVIAYIASKQFAIDIDLNEEFLAACENVGNVSIAAESEINTDTNKTVLYPNGTFATSTIDDGAALAFILPRLHLINQYKDFIALEAYNNIIPSHKVVALGVKRHFFHNSTVLDPNISTLGDYKYLNINMALLAHSVYGIFDDTELQQLVGRFATSRVSDGCDAEIPPFVEYAAAYAVYPRSVDADDVGIKMPLFDLESRIDYMRINNFMPISIRSQTKDTLWPIAIDLPNRTRSSAFVMNNDAAPWETDTCLFNIDAVGNAIVGAVKMGSDITKIGAQDVYFVCGPSETSIMNVFSSGSFSNTDDAINYTIFSFESTYAPQISAFEGYKHDLEPPEGITYYYRIDTGKPIEFVYTPCGAAFSEAPFAFLLLCSENIFVACREEKKGLWVTTLSAKTLHTIEVKNESATNAYPYISITITRICEQFPDTLPRMYFVSYNRERNVIHYNDFRGTNKFDVYSQSINKSIFTNLTITPTLSGEKRAAILIVDRKSAFGSATAFFDARRITVRSIANAPVIVNSANIGEAKRIKVVVQ